MSKYWDFVKTGCYGVSLTHYDSLKSVQKSLFQDYSWTKGVQNVTVCCQASAGRDSQAIADWLVDAACHWVSSNRDLAISEVVDFFESILYQEMHLLIEDGSTEEVSNLILDFYVKCSTLNEEDVIAAMRTLPKCDLSKCQVSLITFSLRVCIL